MYAQEIICLKTSQAENQSGSHSASGKFPKIGHDSQEIQSNTKAKTESHIKEACVAMTREAKITDFQPTLVVQQNVGRFEVPVHNVVGTKRLYLCMGVAVQKGRGPLPPPGGEDVRGINKKKQKQKYIWGKGHAGI